MRRASWQMIIGLQVTTFELLDDSAGEVLLTLGQDIDNALVARIPTEQDWTRLKATRAHILEEHERTEYERLKMKYGGEN